MWEGGGRLWRTGALPFVHCRRVGWLRLLQDALPLNCGTRPKRTPMLSAMLCITNVMLQPMLVASNINLGPNLYSFKFFWTFRVPHAFKTL